VREHIICEQAITPRVDIGPTRGGHEPSATPMADPPGEGSCPEVVELSLARLHEHGAGLLPDPEKSMRSKAAALAADEAERMDAAAASVGCVQLRPPEEDAD
jgi:hypothetical protein